MIYLRLVQATEAFDNYEVEGSIDKLIEATIKDHEQKKKTSSKDLYIGLLNQKLKRKNGNRNIVL